MKIAAFICAAMAGVFAAGAANATIIRADFRSELDLPVFSVGPRVLERLDQAVPNAGFELDETDEISNPNFWSDSLQVDFDPATNILSLTGTNLNTYQTITVALTDIQFSAAEQIIGFSPLSVGNAVTASGLTPAPTLDASFTADTLLVSYAVQDIPGEDLFEINPATDTFLVTLGPVGPTVVPLPASLPLMAAALGALAMVRRRRAG